MLTRFDSMNAFWDPVSRLHGDMRAGASCPRMLISIANDEKKRCRSRHGEKGSITLSEYNLTLYNDIRRPRSRGHRSTSEGSFEMMPLYRKLTTLCYAAVLAFGLAACGGGGTETAEAPPVPDPGPDLALGAAQMAAAAAATAAEDAATAAEGAVMAQDANAAADAASYAVANNTAMRARAAATAARGASDAAAATDDTAAAEAQQAIAEAKQGEAETEQGNAEMYAGMVADAHQANLDEIQRQMDVADARTAAMGSYMAADADAGKAEMQAAEAETTAPGSPGAVTAGEAATAARMAANAAKAAHDAIMDEMTKADADAQAAEAATQAGHANAGYMTAMAENDDIQTTGSQIAENNRKNAVTAARKYGGAAAGNAKESAGDARIAANAAGSAYNDANGEYERAKSARTNSVKAKEYADAAGAAYTAANSAAGAAHAAYTAAKAAVDGVMDDTSLEDANAARDTAEAQEGIAMGHMSTAMTQRTAAEGAEMKATMYADDHVVGLLVMANAEHITTAADPFAEESEAELGLIRKNQLAHIKVVNTAVATANADSPVADPAGDAPHHGGGVVTASWHYYGDLGDDNIISDAAAITSDAANADTEPGEGLPAISVNPEDSGGDAVALIHAALGPDDQAGTDDDVSANFAQGPGLGAFSHEKYFGRNNDTDDDGDFDVGETRQRMIVFTDLTQAEATVPAESVSLTNEPVTSASRVTPTVRPAITGEDLHDFMGTYDHDGNPATAVITGTFDCVDPTACRVTRTGTGDQGEHVAGQTKVTSISGYAFTGTGTTPGVLSMLDDTWLAFGAWLQETGAEVTNAYVFGAFADGGAAIGDDDEPSTVASVTGDATYQGKAAGVHSTATAVDFFHGDATLNAKFGDGTEIGTITGMIHNIEAGGRPVTGNIEMVVADPGATTPSPNIVDAGTFGGRARMHDTGENDSSGEDIYRYTGGWSGTFYNHLVNDPDTDPVMENTRAPGSVAGTFGVGRADDTDTMDVDETESYVGAFGAHCTGSNCNPHD